ncbi:multiple sugar transport system permease protein [Butyrivibrio proteoclasticus]|uniref:Multiple sugar transport system permease protein n=1 Tax=Butyrivibrio proteoclasticus TaxID=43305 RepID=A0A1I5WBV1_9FIRM|nr:carbohydrate ABC transporter permease [Butyrivibrio proteoclasticus]SFQ17192.1 multiple sugar transport system permease protein [Butyrivibrio proteoclasticus]
MNTKRKILDLIYHILVLLGAFVMIYPLLWMIFSSFKPTTYVLPTAKQLIPSVWTLDNYKTGWKGFMGYTFATFFKNSFFISITSTFGTLISSSLVAYALQRLDFKLKKPLFILVLSTMMLPPQILMIPQYMWFRRLGWVGTYFPMILPYFFAIQGFFVYLIMNFIQGVPKELDEAAKIDGCSFYGIYFRIILPLIVPAMITSAIFSFIWRWDDYLSALLYVTKPEMRPISLALKLFNDPSAGSDIGATLAMSTLSIVPATILFLIFQKSLVEGIASSGIKG